MISKNGKCKKVIVTGFLMVVEEEGKKSHVIVSENALRTIMRHVPKLTGKEIGWNASQSKVTVSY